MSKLNFRTYGATLYPHIEPYISKYLETPISKDTFISMFKSGTFTLSDIQLKQTENIKIRSNLILSNCSCHELMMTIPNETEFFKLSLINPTFELDLLLLTEQEIEDKLKENILSLITGFKSHLIETIEKTDSKPSFLEVTINNMLNNFIKDMNVSFENIKITGKHFENRFTASIAKLEYIEGQNELSFTDLSTTLNSSFPFINKINCLVKVLYQEGTDKSEIDIHVDNSEITMNSAGYQGIISIIDTIRYNKYQELLLRIKKCIAYKRYKAGDRKDADGSNLKQHRLNGFQYAIRTVILLRKYIVLGKKECFDLCKSTKDKIGISVYKEITNGKNYISNSNICILSNDIILSLSKEYIRDTLIKNKNKPSLAKGFSMLFKKADKDEKSGNSLSEEEENQLNSGLTQENIEKYLNCEVKFLPTKIQILNKIESFFTNINVHLHTNSITFTLISNTNKSNENISQTLSNIDLLFNVSLKDNLYICFTIGDINSSGNTFSLFKNKNNANAIYYKYENKQSNFIFGYNDIILTPLFLELCSRLYTISVTPTYQMPLLSGVNQLNFHFYNFNSFTEVIKIPNGSFVSDKGFVSVTIGSVSRDVQRNEIEFEFEIKDTVNKRSGNQSYHNTVKPFKVNIRVNEENNKYTFSIQNTVEVNITEGFVDFIIDNIYNKLTNINSLGTTQNCGKNKANGADVYPYSFDFKTETRTSTHFDVDIDIKCFIIKYSEYVCNSSLSLSEFKYSISQNTELSINKIEISTDKRSHFLVKTIDYLWLPSPPKPKSKYQTQSTIEIKTINISYFASSLLFKYMMTDLLSTSLNDSSARSIGNTQFLLFTMGNQITTLLKIPKTMEIKYSPVSAVLNVNLPSPELNITPSVIDQIVDSFNIPINWDVFIEWFYCRVEMIKPLGYLHRFVFELESIVVSNEKTERKEILNYTFKTIKMKDQSHLIAQEEEIQLVMNCTNYSEIRFDTKLKNVFISGTQKNIYDLIESIDYKKLQNYQDTNYNCNSLNSFNKKSSALHPDNPGISPALQRESTTTNFLISIIASSVNINLCGEHYEKGAVISFDRIKYGQSRLDMEYAVSIKNINIKYYDTNNIETPLGSRNPTVNVAGFTPTASVIEVNQSFISDIYSDETSQFSLIKSKKDSMLNIKITSILFLLRVDSFKTMQNYFYNSVPFSKVYTEVKKLKKEMQLKFSVGNGKLLLQTSFDSTEMLSIDTDDLLLIYKSTTSLKVPFGDVFLQLNTINGQFISNNVERKGFYSQNDFFKGNANISETALTLNGMLDSMTINLSYKDIISFLKAYQLNNYYLNNDTRLLKYKSLQSLDSTQMSRLDSVTNEGFQWNKIKTAIEFDKIEITGIDNSSSTYYPFMNITLDKLITTIENGMIMNGVHGTVLSYNYISGVWEPTVENAGIDINIIPAFDYEKHIIFDITVDNIGINLSDMNISFVFVALNRWLSKFFEEQNNFEHFNKEKYRTTPMKNSQCLTDSIVSNEDKISNNKVINYSGNSFKIRYLEAEYTCGPLAVIPLDYVYKDSNKKCGLVYDDKKCEFTIPIEKMGVRTHRIPGTHYHFVSEVTGSKERSIDISIYSPVLFRNKTKNIITVVLTVPCMKEFRVVLTPGMKSGIPFDYLNSTFRVGCDNTLSKNTFSSKEIINFDNTKEYKQPLNFGGKDGILKLKRNIQNVKELGITNEYTICNYLPCQVIVYTGKQTLKLSKCSEGEIDFKTDLYFQFELIIDGDNFKTKWKKYFGLDKHGVISFISNKRKSITFNLPIIYNRKSSKTELIIFSEYLLKNDSGLGLKITSSNKATHGCFPVDKNIFIISSEPDLTSSSFQLQIETFKSSSISFRKLLELTSNGPIPMKEKNNKILNLLLCSRGSHVSNNHQNIMSTIYSIQPLCKINNILSSKNFYISLANNSSLYLRYSPDTSQAFHFFYGGKTIKVRLGISDLNEQTPAIWSEPIYGNEFGGFTFCVENEGFNIEIRDNIYEQITDIYVTETTVDNAKIGIENQTANFLVVYQKKYEDNLQVVNSKSKQPCKVYNHYNTVGTLKIDGISLDGNIDGIHEFNIRRLTKQLVGITESNGLKIKIVLYDNQAYLQHIKGKSCLEFSFKIKAIGFSLIADNEYKDKKLHNYQRKDIGFLLLKDIKGIVINQKIQSLLNETLVTLSGSIYEIGGYNQISSYGKFPLVGYNDQFPFGSINTEFSKYSEDKISIIKQLNYKLSKIGLGVDPNFFVEGFEFVNNIIYRMNGINFNIDEIFILDDFLSQASSSIRTNQSHLCKADNITIPNFDLRFELSQIGGTDGLMDKFQYTEMNSNIVKNLAGHSHTLKGKSHTIPMFLGGVADLLIGIYSAYKLDIMGSLTSIGLKSLFLGIINGFHKNEKPSNVVALDRLRQARAFYGKYKSIQNYNALHAEVYDNINKNCNFFLRTYFFINAVKGVKHIFVFTNLTLFIMNRNYIIEKTVDYFYVSDVDINKEKLIILYNQVIDNQGNMVVVCDNEMIAKSVGRIGKEEIQGNENEFLN